MLLWVKVSSWAAMPPRAALEVVLEGVAVQHPAAGQLAVAVEDDAVVDADPLAVADGGRLRRCRGRRRAGCPASASTLGPEVRVAAGDERHPVDHGGDVGVDELLRGGPVQVEVVDDGDVAGTAAGAAGCGCGDPPWRCRRARTGWWRGLVYVRVS